MSDTNGPSAKQGPINNTPFRNKAFVDAYEAGLVEPATLHDGTPLIVAGIQYYRAAQDGINMLMGRFHALSDTIRRHDQLKLSGEHIDTALASYDMLFRRIRAQANLDVEQVLDAVTEGMVLTERLKQRKDMGLSIEQVYEIASIWYFSDQEDPGAVDHDLNRKKIQDWCKWDNAGELYATFFLHSPIGDFLPLTELSDANILSYLQVAGQQELLDLTRMLLRLNSNGPNNAMTNIFASRKATLIGYDILFEQLLSSTTTTDQPLSEPNSAES